MKQKLMEMIQVTFGLHINEFIFVWFHKNENGRQNHSSSAKTELLRRAGITNIPFSLILKIPPPSC